MGLRHRPEQVGRIIILRIDPGFLRHQLRRHGHLIHVVAAGRVPVHLLQQQKIRLQLRCRVHGAADIFPDCFRGIGPGLRAAIHKKAVIGAVRAKSQIIGDSRIDPLRFGLRRAGILHGQRQPVL